jgi:hypothetical protein
LSTSKSPSRHKIDLNLIDDASKLLRIVMESYGWRYIKLEVIAGIKKEGMTNKPSRRVKNI